MYYLLFFDYSHYFITKSLSHSEVRKARYFNSSIFQSCKSTNTLYHFRPLQAVE